MQSIDPNNRDDLTQSDVRLLQEATALGIPLVPCNNGESGARLRRVAFAASHRTGSFGFARGA